MIHAVLLCCAILGDGGKPAGPTAADRTACEAARAKAGKNAAAHVQLELWCEANGFSAERIKHLTLPAFSFVQPVAEPFDRQSKPVPSSQN